MQDSLLANSPIAQEIAEKVISATTEVPVITYQHIALTIIGALIFNLMRYDEFKRSGDKLGIVSWLDKNWISLILSSLSIVTMFMLKGELKDIAGFDMSNRLGCFLAGFTAHTFISMAKGTANKMQIARGGSNTPPPPSV